MQMLLPSRKTIIFLLIIISWLAFTITAISINEIKNVHNVNGFNLERGFIATAVSNAVYGGKRGGFYRGIMDQFDTNKTTIDDAFHRISMKGFELKDFIKVNRGDSFTLSLLYDIGFRLFGANATAITLIFCSLLFLSLIAFTIRYNDHRLLFAPATLFCLTLMIFTPLCTRTDIINQVPIAGFRYFTILAALPTIHILLELIDHNTFTHISQRCFILQTILIGVCGFIAKSSAYAFIAIALFGIIIFFIRRHADVITVLRNKLFFFIFILMTFSIIFYYSIPKPIKDLGFATDAVWHRVLISLALNPEWPFKGLQYDCRDVFPNAPAIGVSSDNWDRNGQCIVVDYGKKHHFKNPGAVEDNHQIQTIERNEFFKIAIHYPKEVLMTFLYYKPLYLYRSLQQLESYQNPAPGIFFIVMIFVSGLSLLILRLILFNKRITGLNYLRLYGLILCMSFSIFLMPIVAWGNVLTISEFVFILHLCAVFLLIGIADVFIFIFNYALSLSMQLKESIHNN